MKALYNISYGVYILTAKDAKMNGCVINTLIQVTSSPVRISITVNKENYTTQLIEKTGKFNVSILDKNTSFDLIKHFGFSSGKVENKFDNFKDYKMAENGIPYITKNVNSYLSAKVVSKTDVGTHVTFVADVLEDVVLTNAEPLTYAYYMSNIKPKPETKNARAYVCRVCGYVYNGESVPSGFICPICKHGAEDFELKKSESKTENKKVYCPICGYSEDADKSSGTCIICGAKMSNEKML